MKPTLKERIITVALTVIVIAAVYALTACATKPPCPVAEVRVLTTNDGAMWFLFDETNVKKIQKRFEGVRLGECVPGENWAEMNKNGGA